jgi:pimeloyl-ACP methyl ester carboxylesterase
MKSFRVIARLSLLATAQVLLFFTGPRLAAAPDSATGEGSAKRKVDVGGRSLELKASGSGQPVVVIECGLGEPGADSDSWSAVVQAVQKQARVALYSRAGLGGSEAAPGSPRTTKDQVQDLAALLSHANIPAPYLLVGHSIGGFNIRVFAEQFPEKVAGAVLVDSSHPDQWSKWLAALPPETAGEPDGLAGMRKALVSIPSDPNSNPERLDIGGSTAQVRAARGFGNKPLRVVSHHRRWRMDPSMSDEVSERVEKVWDELQESLLSLSTRSARKVAQRAGHYVQAEEPQIVVDAILEVLAELRQAR